jgi:ferredoxin
MMLPTYILTISNSCRSTEACGECLDFINEDIHDHIDFHGLLFLSQRHVEGEAGQHIRDAISICPAEAIRIDKL